jgi:hypothetical protein
LPFSTGCTDPRSAGSSTAFVVGVADHEHHKADPEQLRELRDLLRATCSKPMKLMALMGYRRATARFFSGPLTALLEESSTLSRLLIGFPLSDPGGVCDHRRPLLIGFAPLSNPEGFAITGDLIPFYSEAYCDGAVPKWCDAEIASSLFVGLLGCHL